MIVRAICTKCGGTDVKVDTEQDHPGVGICTTCGSTFIDDVCEHGTAVDVHCCNCHSGFLFDLESCTCTKGGIQ